MIEEKFRALADRLDEATLRLWAAVEARALGHGGVSAVASASGLSRTTIYAGLRELAAPATRGQPLTGRARRVRAKGGGRKKLTVKDPTLLRDLDALVEPTTRGDRQSPLRWTCKSTPRLAKELAACGHPVSQRSVCDLLAQLDYSLQARARCAKAASTADRDAQFGHIARWRRSIRRPASRWCRSTRRRRSWSGTSRTADASGSRKGPGGGARLRLHRSGTGQGCSVWRL